MVTGKRYGHDTSNIVESANAYFLEDRELPILQMLDSIWHKEMDKRYSRYERASKLPAGCCFIPHDHHLLSEANKYSAENQEPRQSRRGNARVVQQDGRTFVVNLDARTCTCSRFREFDVPCGHAISVIYRQNEAPVDYMPSYLKNMARDIQPKPATNRYRRGHTLEKRRVEQI